MNGPVQAVGMSGIFRSEVGRLCEEIDGRVNSFVNRLPEGDWPCLRVDATCVKVRQGGWIVSVGTIAVGLNDNGRREIAGLAVG